MITDLWLHLQPMPGCSAAISRRAFPSTAALERPAAEAPSAVGRVVRSPARPAPPY
jgi:hypothetical protein